jgi:glutaredoxin
MKNVILFYFRGCPHCAAAERWISELQREYPELAAVPIERIDERLRPVIANRYGYWYVPTFYVDGRKAHEGACSREIVERVLREAAE